MNSHEFQQVATLLPQELLFLKVWGSHSHNTELPTSDTDYLAVYVTPTRDILCLDKPSETVVHSKPDLEAHEGEKFCRLLIKGNPSMIEMLWTDRMCQTTTRWDELRAIRQEFLSTQVVEQYVGYAKGQLHRLDSHTSLHTKGGTYNTKWAYHMMRVLGDAATIAKGDGPIIWKEGSEHDLLMDIRLGKYEPDEIAAMSQTRLDDIEGLKPWPLPEKGNLAALNDWLLSIRLPSVSPIVATD